MRALLFAADRDKLIEAGIFDPIKKWSAPDVGAGKHGSRSGGLFDIDFSFTYGKAKLLAAGADAAGLTNASRHMLHYLGNTGEPLEVDVDKILRDVPRFRQEVEVLLASREPGWREQALTAYNSAGGSPVAVPIEVPWYGDIAGGDKKEGFYFDDKKDQEKDWFYAIGGMGYSITGVAIARTGENGEPTVSMEYRIEVRDRCNWDENKSVDIPVVGLHIPDGEMGKLHLEGRAHEYDVHGQTDVVVRSLDTLTPPLISPSINSTDGTREDVSRGQGKTGER